MIASAGLVGCGGEVAIDLEGRTEAPPPPVQALLKAARRGAVADIRTFAEEGVDLDARDPVDRSTALIRAVKFGELEAVEALLAGGASPEIGDRHDVRPLHFAASRGEAAIARVLLSAGAPVDAAELVEGHTPLHRAALAGRDDTAAVLLEAGADPNAGLRFGGPSPALEVAIGQSYVEVARLLIEAGADVEQKDAFGRSPLHQVLQLAHEDDPELVRWLLAAGASRAVRDDDGLTVVESARERLGREREGSVYHERRRRTLAVLESDR